MKINAVSNRVNKLGMVFMVLICFTFFNVLNTGAQTQVTDVLVNNGAGRIFDGIGGVSGGGGTSRLLIDYPAKQQNEILDYLFKPGYGASLHILKVEIGSDVNTTNGAEASHMRTPGDHNYNRGYEWWLMKQAKLRNPHIKLYALEWGAPGWFKDGFWSDDNINYIINWLKHAKADHNLTIDYIGGWNERGYNKPWYQKLKAALDKNGLQTKIVADDGGGWSVAKDMSADSAFRSVVSIVGQHYPCSDNGKGTGCTSSTEAQALNKPLWASEHGTNNYDLGAGAIARSYNRGYIEGKMTAYLNWALIAAWYPTLPHAGEGLMLADEPWSGNYKVGKSIWAIAHTAQFVKPGWQYIDSACGFLKGNGTYVTLKSGKDYSIIAETMDANNSQQINIKLAGDFAGATVHVWQTNLNSADEKDYFVKQSDISPVNNSFSVLLKPGCVYSFTTTTGQSKGEARPPARSALRLPYTDNFEAYSTDNIPRYFSTLEGAFEIAGNHGARAGKYLRQQVSQAPISWLNKPMAPFTIMGDPDWKNYSAAIDVLMDKPGYVELYGRVQKQPMNWRFVSIQGYHLRLNSSGAWSLYYQNPDPKDTAINMSPVNTVLASGRVPLGLNSWHKIKLSFFKSRITVFVDQKQVASLTDSHSSGGQIGLGVSPWINACFDNLSINSTDTNQSK